MTDRPTLEDRMFGRYPEPMTPQQERELRRYFELTARALVCGPQPPHCLCVTLIDGRTELARD